MTGRRPAVPEAARNGAQHARPAPTRLSGFWVPLLLLAALAGLTAFGINGSSAAAIRPTLGASVSSDPHLLTGVPLNIRADEWAINTPMSILQARTGMPRVQPRLGDGADMALGGDVPVADRWALFRPQHWGYLALPLDQGFAFHWWFPALSLAFSLWLLTVTLLPGRNLLGLLIGTAAVFSPFMQWWNLAGSFLPEALAVLACALFVRILHARAHAALWWYAAALAWTMVSFALVLYPPFQIPCVLVTVAFCVGYLLFVGPGVGWRPAITRAAVVVGCGAAALVALGLFLLDHRDAVQAIAASLYPGQRTVPSGGYSVARLFSGFLDRRLTVPGAAASIDVNQSEAASPLLVGVLAVPVVIWLLVSARRRRERLNPVLLLLLAVTALFLGYLFIPRLDLLAKLTLLNRVPGNRLLLGMGMLSDVLLVALAWQLRRTPVRSRAGAISTFAVVFAALAVLVLYLHSDHAVFVGSVLVSLAIAATIALAVGLWVAHRPELGAGLLVVVSFLIAGTVNPLSAGVSTTVDLPIAAAIKQVDNAAPGGWIMQTNRIPAAALLEDAVHTYSVVYNYPQLELWHQLDPTGTHAESYNRYGYADFTLRRGPVQFPPHLLDQFSIAIDGCDPFIQRNVKHIVTDYGIDTACTKLRSSVTSGSRLFYIYDVVAP